MGVLCEALSPVVGRGDASAEMSADDEDDGERSEEGGEKAEFAEPKESWDALSERLECGRPKRSTEPGGMGRREIWLRSATVAPCLAGTRL